MPRFCMGAKQKCTPSYSVRIENANGSLFNARSALIDISEKRISYGRIVCYSRYASSRCFFFNFYFTYRRALVLVLTTRC